MLCVAALLAFWKYTRYGGSLAVGNPGLMPRDDALLHLFNDSLGDCCVNVHFVFLSSCGEHSKCGRMKCSPGFFVVIRGAFAGMLW